MPYFLTLQNIKDNLNISYEIREASQKLFYDKNIRKYNKDNKFR